MATKSRPWWLPLALIAVTTAVGAGFGYKSSSTQQTAQVYESEALMIIHMGREVSSARAELIASGDMRRLVAPGWREFTNTELALLRNPLLTKATFGLVKEELNRRRKGTGEPAIGGGSVGPARGWLALGQATLNRALRLEFENEAVEMNFPGLARTTINAVLMPRSNLLRLTCSSPRPDLSKLVLETWVAVFQAYHIQSYSQSESIPVWEKELKLARADLEAAQMAFTEFRIANKVFDFRATMTARVEERTTLSGQLAVRRAELAARVAETESLAQGGDDAKQRLARAAAAAAEAEVAALIRGLEDIDADLSRLEALRIANDSLADRLQEAENNYGRLSYADRIARANQRLDEAGLCNVRLVSPPGDDPPAKSMFGFPTRVADTIKWGAIGLVVGIVLVLLLNMVSRLRS